METLNDRLLEIFGRYVVGGLLGTEYARLWRLVKSMARATGESRNAVYEHYLSEARLNMAEYVAK